MPTRGRGARAARRGRASWIDIRGRGNGRVGAPAKRGAIRGGHGSLELKVSQKVFYGLFGHELSAIFCLHNGVLWLPLINEVYPTKACSSAAANALLFGEESRRERYIHTTADVKPVCTTEDHRRCYTATGTFWHHTL